MNFAYAARGHLTFDRKNAIFDTYAIFEDRTKYHIRSDLTHQLGRFVDR